MRHGCRGLCRPCRGCGQRGRRRSRPGPPARLNHCLGLVTVNARCQFGGAVSRVKSPGEAADRRGQAWGELESGLRVPGAPPPPWLGRRSRSACGGDRPGMPHQAPAGPGSRAITPSRGQSRNARASGGSAERGAAPQNCRRGHTQAGKRHGASPCGTKPWNGTEPRRARMSAPAAPRPRRPTRGPHRHDSLGRRGPGTTALVCGFSTRDSGLIRSYRGAPSGPSGAGRRGR